MLNIKQPNFTNRLNLKSQQVNNPFFLSPIPIKIEKYKTKKQNLKNVILNIINFFYNLTFFKYDEKE